MSTEPGGGLVERDVRYEVAGDEMAGILVRPIADEPLPAVVLVHDAFGLNDDTRALARRLAGLGLAVFAADVWGGRRTPSSGAEIGALIGGMVAERDHWIARVAAAHDAAAAQPEVAEDRIATLGHCFGASSALEYLRTGGRTRGVASVHAGLDLLAPGWDDADPSASVLICAGADDPLSTPAQWQALKSALTARGIAWEFDLYSGAQHGFTNPRSDDLGMPGAAYQPRAAARAWGSATAFLLEVLGCP
ncbi:dienelactone hydrolase family protein [Microbacterium sp. NPDC058389]|uniref:dienelactone hydrolase family protein n=1 Tax=Microbacterium sp. NPDC058389 TaxID=3346475 RepID=UPI00364B4957